MAPVTIRLATRTEHDQGSKVLGQRHCEHLCTLLTVPVSDRWKTVTNAVRTDICRTDAYLP